MDELHIQWETLAVENSGGEAIGENILISACTHASKYTRIQHAHTHTHTTLQVMRTSLIPPTQYENAAPTTSPFIFVNTGCFEHVQARAGLHAGIYDSSIGNCQNLEATKQTKELHG